MASGTRPISQRDMTLRPAGEIRRRVCFALYALGGVGGVALTGVGFVRHDRTFLIVGGAGLALAVVLHFTRSRWGAAGFAAEIKSNPFKPARVPKSGDSV
jgi:hypothetical protein